MQWVAIVVCVSSFWPFYRVTKHPWVQILNANAALMWAIERADAEGKDTETGRELLRQGIELMPLHWGSFLRWVALAAAWIAVGAAMLAESW